MFVLTVDQKASRSTGDKVPNLLTDLKWLLRRDLAPRVAFGRTIGDEVQGVLDSPQAVYAVFRHLMRSGQWYLGIGIGGVVTPLPTRSSEGAGAAFVYAREAVEDAKVLRGRAPVSVRSNDSAKAEELQSLLRLLGSIIQNRSAAAWEAADLLMDPDGTPTGLKQKDVADRLGISEAAVSKRVKLAALDEEREVLSLVARLLDELNGTV
ncbi:SatD family protein [Timonella senegalensis]|uniref:SatD family protein n=1 Tax=Timonella senegalensis TaxID=1465825 RepID=UPI0002FC2BA5|nr:SatD family protein [Timonella senegalensis]